MIALAAPASCSRAVAFVWTPDRDRVVVEQAHRGAGPIAKRLGCKRDDVYRRAKRLNVRLAGSKRPWREDEEILRDMVEEGYTPEECAKALRRTVSAVKTKAYALELEFDTHYSASKRDRLSAACRAEAQLGPVSLASHRLPLNRISEAFDQ